MRVIVAGYLTFEAGTEAAVLLAARPLIDAALAEDGCIHYAWSVDPLVPGRVWVYEEWTSSAALAAHFEADSYVLMRDHLGASGLTGAVVNKYHVDCIEPVYDEMGNAQAYFGTL